MRIGFTTGSCAAAAAKAAAFMLLTGKKKETIKIITPKGIEFSAQIHHINQLPGAVSCSVIKDGGDDPDVTTGCHIVATVRVISAGSAGSQPQIVISGGEGVGIVTKPGLDQPVGEAAINRVPRQMISREVLEVCSICDFCGKLGVEIAVPQGKEIAEKTFNGRLGIVNGISILGTSGIVEPMSTQALLDTIKIELNQQKILGCNVAAVSPGNYGLDFMKERFDYNLDKSVKCSNFIGDTIDMAAEAGFEKMLLTGHIGKLIKVSGGIMNTHSREGDCRMELMAAAAVIAGCRLESVRNILEAVTTEEGIRILKEEGKCQQAMDYIMEKIMFFLNKRAAGRIEIECMVYCNQFGLLGFSKNAFPLLEECKKNQAG